MSVARPVTFSLVALALLLILGVALALQHPRFGAAPKGERLASLQGSPHYADGAFHNAVETPVLLDGESVPSIIVGNLLGRRENLRPEGPIPIVRTDLRALDAAQDTIVWLGHSSYYVQLGGQRILIDPVFSAFAAPVSFSTRAFDGTTLWSAEDLPRIDALLITHDHWDHLDHATIRALAPKVGQVIAPLGVGAHFARWGSPEARIREGDWFDAVSIADVTVHLVPARHYSGRLLRRNQTLWAGFVLESASRRLLFSGDSGYGPHFEEIARRFGRFDVAALDMGQYDARWPYIHMTPEEAVQAAEDLRATALLPAHVGRFSIARHAWDEPFERLRAASEDRPVAVLTPMIGEPVRLDATGSSFGAWWSTTGPRRATIAAQ